jgi:hypothetical protein
MKKHLLAVNCLPGLLGVLLLLAPQDSLAVTEILNPTVKMSAVSIDGIFQLDDDPVFGLLTQQILSSDPNVPTIDKRAVFEFPLASVPSSSPITAATLELIVTSTQSSVIPVFGYAGDGIADVGDVAVTANQIGTSDLITQTGSHFIDLEIEFITSLIGNSTHLGLLLMGDEHGAELGFGALGVEPAVLSISFGIPGDFNQDGDVDGLDFLLWQRDNGVGDLADWENNYGAPAPIAAITSVPEPATLFLVLLGALGLVATRPSAGSAEYR